MKRREAKRKRLRESAPVALTSLLTLTCSAQSVFDELCSRFVHPFQIKAEVEVNCGDPVIEGRGLEELLTALSNTAKIEITAEDVLHVTSRLQRNQSTVHKFYVAELCFAISQAQRASNTHERRRKESESELQDKHTSNDKSIENEKQVELVSPENKSINSDNVANMYNNTSNLNEVVAGNMSLPLIKFYKEKVFDAICTKFHQTECQNEEKNKSTEHINNNIEECENDEWNANMQNNTCHVKDEWWEFMECLHTPLPMSIRVHCNETSREALVHRLLLSNETLRSWLKPALCLPLSMQVYSCSNATYHTIHELQLLCRAIHSSGGASFQELVSTLPAIALQVEPHHRVLDMCAAPGSKTLHILDCVMQKSEIKLTRFQKSNDTKSKEDSLYSVAPEVERTIVSLTHKVIKEKSAIETIEDVNIEYRGATSSINNITIPQGVIIGNEKDFVKATQTLPTRLKRFHAPNVLCTRCDATKWPHLYKRNNRHENIRNVNSAEDNVEPECCSREMLELPEFREERFDRILCDVPCSGDGTIRKERSALHTWSSTYVQALVPTQQRLLRRGLDMLAVNGILVYSTCSLNPLENENVIAQALKTYKDSVELLDVNAILKEANVKLHSCSGIADMATLQRVLREISTCTTVPNSDSKYHIHNLESCVDDKTTLQTEKEREMEEEFERRDLEIAQRQYDGAKLLRVLPHRDNTGGFFVAALRKVKMPDWSGPTITEQKLNQWTRGKLWRPVGVNDSVWINITDFYGLDRYDKNVFQYYTESEQTAELQPMSRSCDSTTTKECNNKNENINNFCGLVPVYHLNSSGGECKRIVLITIGVAEMLFATRPFKGPGVEIVSAGMRAFEKLNGSYLSQATCRWRATMESSSFIAPHCALAKRIWTLHLHEPSEAVIVERLLRDGFVSLHECGHILVQDATRQHNSQAHVMYEASVECKDNKWSEKEHAGSPLIKSSALETLSKQRENYEHKMQQVNTDEVSSLESCHDAHEWVEMLSSAVEVGGMFVAIVHDKNEFNNSSNKTINTNLPKEEKEEQSSFNSIADGVQKFNEDNTWYLTANLTSGKVELTVDTSLRAFGLLVYFGSKELLHITEENKGEASSAKHIN